jgi:hypothetical protein
MIVVFLQIIFVMETRVQKCTLLFKGQLIVHAKTSSLNFLLEKT